VDGVALFIHSWVGVAGEGNNPSPWEGDPAAVQGCRVPSAEESNSRGCRSNASARFWSPLAPPYARKASGVLVGKPADVISQAGSPT